MAKDNGSENADEDDSDNHGNEDKVIWSSHQVVRENNDRRISSNRRHFVSRGMTVPDMRGGVDRRTGEDRRKVKLIITGRAIDV